ncbi:MAG TPA: XrtA/PEP-CTERM system histidine kinase PrsK [Novosphingobium sp.]|nr:XrtA/PEP-CTERM system histidine kinase PrsK [Novosphingobium sp.]
MTVPQHEIWLVAGVAAHVCGAVSSAAVAVWLSRTRGRFGPARGGMIAALFLTAAWCVCIAALGGASPISWVAESGRNLGWLFVIYRLFAADGRHASLAPIRPVVAVLGAVELLSMGTGIVASQLSTDSDVAALGLRFLIMFRLLVTVGALVLVHNLYAGASRESRASLRFPASGLAIVWAFDLNLYTIAYLGGDWPSELAATRGFAALVLASLLAIGANNDRQGLRLRPSRAVTFQTFSLLVIGFYLVGMVSVAQWLSYAGGNFARLMELGFLTVASAVAMLVLPSRRMRGWFRVSLEKHLFQHRYDYREEWLRFTRTIASGGAEALPLGERVVQSVADIAECPAGLLLTPGDHGDLSLAARWNWPEIGVPATAIPARSVTFFERQAYIADLDDLRAGQDLRGAGDNIPAWLLDDQPAWALVPLIHFERLVGMVVLARPANPRRFDWEDFDLLRVVGQQLASYLAENSSQDALIEASRFDDFHRRIAFVMHDIKNLASQFSLLARNAELHAEKKEFRDDMLVTLRNSSEKLNALIARLSRYGNGVVERLDEVRADAVVLAVMERFKAHPQVLLAECRPLSVKANAHSLEQVLVHLVQNAIDASADDAPVFLSLTSDGINARFEVVDSGSGMSPDFVRTRLFKPFVSTKSGGFGIGAFEARELVRAMRGRLDVESREGLGSRFIIRIPLAAVSDLYDGMAMARHSDWTQKAAS